MRLGKKDKPKALAAEGLKKFGSALKDILVAASTHPTTACLAVMTLSSVGLMVTRPNEKGHEGIYKVSRELDGLFRSAQNLALAAAVSPVAIGALSVIKEAIALKAPKKT